MRSNKMHGPCRTCQTRARERGLALLVALLMLSVLSALGLGLSLVLSVDPLAAANQREGNSTLYIARAALELAAGELAATDAWDPWLAGTVTSSLTDGLPSGTRTLPMGDAIDIGRLTSRLTCGSDAPCSDVQAAAITRDRPWGANNARWQPFVYGPSSRLGLGIGPEHHYVIVWIGDDGEEMDGSPDIDALDGAGSGTVRLVAEAFGGFHSRQSVEAHVSRRCEVTDEGRSCGRGVRVWGWRTRGEGR